MPIDIAPPLEGPGPYQLRRARAQNPNIDPVRAPSTTGTKVKDQRAGGITLSRDGEVIARTDIGGGDVGNDAAGMHRTLESMKLVDLHKLIPDDSEIPKTLRKGQLIEALYAAGITAG